MLRTPIHTNEKPYCYKISEDEELLCALQGYNTSESSQECARQDKRNNATLYAKMFSIGPAIVRSSPVIVTGASRGQRHGGGQARRRGQGTAAPDFERRERVCVFIHLAS